VDDDNDNDDDDDEAVAEAGSEAYNGEDAERPAAADGHRRRVHAAEREADRHRPSPRRSREMPHQGDTHDSLVATSIIDRGRNVEFCVTVSTVSRATDGLASDSDSARSFYYTVLISVVLY